MVALIGNKTTPLSKLRGNQTMLLVSTLKHPPEIASGTSSANCLASSVRKLGVPPGIALIGRGGTPQAFSQSDPMKRQPPEAA